MVIRRRALWKTGPLAGLLALCGCATATLKVEGDRALMSWREGRYRYRLSFPARDGVIDAREARLRRYYGLPYTQTRVTYKRGALHGTIALYREQGRATLDFTLPDGPNTEEVFLMPIPLPGRKQAEGRHPFPGNGVYSLRPPAPDEEAQRQAGRAEMERELRKNQAGLLERWTAKMVIEYIDSWDE